MFRDRACLIIAGEPSPRLARCVRNRSHAFTDGRYPKAMTP
ncbi:hypothetical protein BURPS1106B_0664 [Burkholderia pseudomallei 1106b]|uniref:Uncharacterized protein n=2 Tax=Burkholderia pseudomallei TaxID=28450 RepID=A0A0E1VRV3_BURPE|nr:hypothetical protein BURPS1106A_A1324 [Burkholderia pseudomallei 1106a]EDO93412.1 hypothetical protein BURPSPAST_J0680 [Burkholderia pseudomallei Pasteur 52237]EEP50850.1 conserved hypothetical protein [Burkholderia pseudomallei MSHR346]EES23470.1 hypothetical protein BURPS1106B_0664 [Burkholderia pseudomallei 1106b]EET02716.1 hypothetical protein BURPS1710A_A0477 [Burkholderia pseudomallei 1710a]